MKSAGGYVAAHLLGAAGLLAVWLHLYLPESLKFLAFVGVVIYALGYTFWALAKRKEKTVARLKKIWNEVFDFMYGL